MSNSRKRRATIAATVSTLEARCLLSGLTGSWIGQDGHDLVGPGSTPGGDDVQDIHIALGNLPADKSVTRVDVLGYGGGEWTMNPGPGLTPWAAALVRSQGATSADLFIDPYRVEDARRYSIELDYSDGTLEYVWINGGAADPNLRMPNAALSLRWGGQTSTDVTGIGPNVGPDNRVDAQLTLGHLSTSTDISSAVLTSSDGSSWTFGTNPLGGNSAEIVRRSADPSTGDFFFQPGKNLAGQSLTLVVSYANGKTDSQSLIAGATDPSVAVSTPSTIAFDWKSLTAQWSGQVDDLNAGAGAVKLTLSGLPSGHNVVSATVSDPVGGTWAWLASSSAAVAIDPTAGPLTVRRSSTDSTKADLLFPPGRDESGSSLTVRVVLDNGTTLATSLTGGSVDLSKRIAPPTLTSVVAKPGDNLNDLASRFGTIKLSAGTYNLSQPLVLTKPVTITADPGVILLFSQPSSAAAWSTAIKIQAGNTTLDNFAVRFSGPIRWRSDVSYGPAVIGTTDNTDGVAPGLLVGINLTHLDLQASQASTPWEEAIRLMRLVSAQSGRVVGNTLKGGPVEFFGGPWTITDNTYLGTMANTYSYNVFAAHATHDLDLSRNVITPAVDAGKTWRFLVMTYGGSNDVIQNNMVNGVGPVDGDGVPDVNANEIILTEAYSLKFEGMPTLVSADGRIVQISSPQGDAPRAGDAVGILSGVGAGQYRRIAQVLSPTAFLLDSPLPTGSGAISIAMGFVGETFQNNTIDARRSSTASDLVLAGNHYGTKVIGNTIMGGATPLRLEATPSEHPDIWGWSHASFLAGTISGNTIADGWVGSTFTVDSGPSVKTSQGRTYFSGEFSKNTFAWSQDFFLKRLKAGLLHDPLNLTVDGANSAGMNVSLFGNSVLEPPGVMPGGSLQIKSAIINGVFQATQSITLPTVVPSAPTGLALVNDTGVNPHDGITNDARLRIDPVIGAATGAEYRLAGSSTFFPVPISGVFTPAALVQGLNIVLVRSYDVTGNRSPETSLSLTYNSIAPVANAPSLQSASDSGRSNSDGVTNITTPTFSTSVNEVASLVLLRNGVAVAQRSDNGPLQDLGPVPEGAQAYTLRATDLAGNVATSPPALVTIETTPPKPPAWLTATSDGKVTFDPGNADLFHEYKVNNATTYTSLGASTVFTLTSIAPGTNQVKVRSIDVAGNVSADATVNLPITSVRVTPSVVYLGQDGHDYTGLQAKLGSDGLQDMHFSLQNLPPGRWITGVQVIGVGGGQWYSRPSAGVWGAAVFQVPGSTTADVYIQPYLRSTSRTYYFNVTFDNGLSIILTVSNVTADPKLKMPPTSLGQAHPAGELAPLFTSSKPVGARQTTTVPLVTGHTWKRTNLMSANSPFKALKTYVTKPRIARKPGV